MAGTAHVDQSTLDYGIASGRQWDKTSVIPDFTAAVREHQRRSRAVHRARRVLGVERVGRRRQRRRRTRRRSRSSAAPTIARDAHGNAIGGIRTPAVDVPTESLSGEYDPSKSVICSLFGSRKPFSAADAEAALPDARRLRGQGQGVGRGRGEGRLPARARRRRRSTQQAQAAPVPSRHERRRRARPIEWMAAGARRGAGRRRSRRRAGRARSSCTDRRARSSRARTTSASGAAIRPRTPSCSRCARPRRPSGSWRLDEHALVVTLEPCPMCAGAVWAARVPLLVYGAADPKAGAAGQPLQLRGRSAAQPHDRDRGRRARPTSAGRCSPRSSQASADRSRNIPPGGMRERPNRMVSKTIVAQVTVGSNPTPSASARVSRALANTAPAPTSLLVGVAPASPESRNPCR